MLLSFTPLVIIFSATLADASAANKIFNLKPFKIDLSDGIPRLKNLVRNTHLPEKALYPTVGSDKGAELDVLRELQTEWAETFDWETQQAELNRRVPLFKHYTAVIEGQNVHFVHEKSEDPDAIPVILLHGWPGSFHEFAPVIKPLTQSWTSATGKNVSYNVVVPSLPGFVFSSAAPANRTVDDTARIFNTLMTEVLGYSTFTVHGTDWVISLSQRRLRTFTEQRYSGWNTTGNGYYVEQTTKILLASSSYTSGRENLLLRFLLAASGPSWYLEAVLRVLLKTRHVLAHHEKLCALHAVLPAVVQHNVVALDDACGSAREVK
ncbi:Alpha/Beta hydrolase protein [Mycena latifolia]|nr:Alpha/Beta hydrolase protein [Mycena latifolia]